MVRTEIKHFKYSRYGYVSLPGYVPVCFDKKIRKHIGTLDFPDFIFSVVIQTTRITVPCLTFVIIYATVCTVVFIVISVA